MVKTMEYSAGLTSKLFWLQESRKTASYIADGYDKNRIRDIAWSENIYQVKAEYRAYEVLNIITIFDRTKGYRKIPNEERVRRQTVNRHQRKSN